MKYDYSTVEERLLSQPDGQCRNTLIVLYEKFKLSMEKEDAHLFKIGVAWDSAHSDSYKFARSCLNEISDSLGDANVPDIVPDISEARCDLREHELGGDIQANNEGKTDATEVREVKEDDQQEHQDGNESRQATEASGGDCPLQSGQVEEKAKEVKRGWFGK